MIQSCPIKQLQKAIKDIGVDKVFTKAVKALYQNNLVAIKIGNTLSVQFRTTKGLLQGWSTPPMHYKIFLGATLKECIKAGLEINADKTEYVFTKEDTCNQLEIDKRTS